MTKNMLNLGVDCNFSNTPPPRLSKWQWAIVCLFLLMSMNSWSYGQSPLANPLDLNCALANPVITGANEQFDAGVLLSVPTYHVCADAGELLHYSVLVNNAAMIYDSTANLEDCYHILSSPTLSVSNLDITLASTTPQGQANLLFEFDILVPNFVLTPPANLFQFEIDTTAGNCAGITVQCTRNILNLYIYPKPDFIISSQKISCKPDVYQLTATQIAGIDNPAYGGTWSAGTTINPSPYVFVSLVSTPGNYWFEAQSSYPYSHQSLIKPSLHL